jgi:prepilin-type N-terminal cleavage/methylation domain-containing protein
MYNVNGMWRITLKQEPTKVKSKRGFTMIELIVTIGIIAILSAAVLTLIGQGPQKYSRDGKRQADLETIRSALELYRNDYGGYPQNYASLVTTYMNSWPSDPRSADGRLYGYLGSGCTGSLCTGYSVCAAGEKITTAVGSCGSCGATFTCSIKVTNP